VVREENRGATVRRVSLTEAIEITDARAALEGLVARRAAERATVADRKDLKAIVKDMADAVKHGELVVYAKLNTTLHLRLREIANHVVADDLITNLRNRAAHHQYRLSAVAGRAAQSLPQHRAIVAAVCSADGDAAEAAMRDHLTSVADVLRHWDELGMPG
jgi:DNA-binding GntR family transcriptional regulator